MFPAIKKVTTSKGNTYEYIQIVHNYRRGKKIKQRVILNLGRKEFINSSQIDQLIKVLERFAGEVMVLNALEPDMLCQWSRDFGLPVLYQKLWEQVGLKTIIAEIATSRKVQFNLEGAVFLLVLNRLLNPGSELSCSKWKDQAIYLSTKRTTRRQGDFAKLQLQHLYRTLDFIEDEKETIETRLFEKTRSLFNSKVNLVFFDTTSTYFEGSGKHSRKLLNYGYSKDHRPDRKQIIVGILLDSSGLPIGCEFRPGNSVDSTAISELIGKVKQRFNLENIIWVSDTGTTSETNINSLHKESCGFILGCRLRNVKEVYQKFIDQKKRKKVLAGLGAVKRPKAAKGRADLKYYEFKSERYANRRYLIVYNQQQAKQEQKNRTAIIQRLEKQLQTKQGLKKLIKHKKYQQYLKVETKKTKISIDSDKVKKDALYDGFFVLQTDTALPSEKVIERYKDLSQVEQAFRTLKSPLDLRPIYHRKDRRIKAHIFVNFLALYLSLSLNKLLAKAGVSTEEINDDLADIKQIKMMKIKVKDKTYHLRTELSKTARELFQKLKISPGRRLEIVK